MNKKSKLKKAYTCSLKTLIKTESNNAELGLGLFAWHLKFLRDNLILNNVYDIETEPVKTCLATLNTALAEFSAYLNAPDKTQKTFHWNNFCDFVKFNMEEWLELNDSV